MAELSKMRKDVQIFYGWHNKFTSWLEAQLLYSLPADKRFVSMPLFPMELLLEDDHFEDLQPEQPTTDKVEPSAMGEKRKRKKSKSGKKKKVEKKKVEEKEVVDEHHVNSEAKQQSPVVGSQQRLPEVDQHLEAKASSDKPEPSQEVLQDQDVVEEEVNQNEDDGSEKSIAEEDLLYGKNPNEEENVSEEKDVNEEGLKGQGHKTDEQITIDPPVEQANLKNDDPVPEEGNVAGGSAPGGDQLATTEKAIAGNESPTLGTILRKKRTTKRKVVPQATTYMPVGTDPEPTRSASVEEEKVDEGVSNVVGPKKKKQKVSPTAVGRCNRPRA
jgi:hypothetical protein